MAAPHTVLELVERFNANRSSYKSDQYNEARLRIEFLNPFLKPRAGILIKDKDTLKHIKTLFMRMLSK
jgi:hypothetical protein